MDRFLAFWSFQDPNAFWVLMGSSVLGFSAGMLGCFPFLQKRALVGDVLAHAALPGVTTVFLLFHTKSLLALIIGAMISCFIGYMLINYLVQNTKIKEDSAFAMVLSLFFALGIFQLTIIQKTPLASQAGLDTFLFGQAGALVGDDVLLVLGIASIIVVCVVFFFRAFKYIIFDPTFCSSIGMPIQRYERLLAILVVAAVVTGMQLVGVVLMAAALIIPPAAARYWTDNLRAMIIIAGCIGAFSGISGACISYMAPKMPTGPWMVVSAAFIFIISVCCAPNRGVIARLQRHLRYQRRIHEENVLRSIYLATGEGAFIPEDLVEAGEVLQHRSISVRTFDRVCERLVKKGLALRKAGGIALSETGFLYAEKLTRLHRLWELYLINQTVIRADHVHADAEEIEHVLTDELEAEILAELDQTTKDPHGKTIPGGT